MLPTSVLTDTFPAPPIRGTETKEINQMAAVKTDSAVRFLMGFSNHRQRFKCRERKKDTDVNNADNYKNLHVLFSR